MKAIILAAGYATRMYPLTENTPKPLLPLRGKAVIDYIIEQLNNLPVDEIFVVTNSKFFSHFCEWAKNVKLPVAVLDDGTTSNENRRGAVGDVAFAIAEKGFDDELVVIAGDNYFTYDLREQYDVYRKTGCDTLCGKEFEDEEKIKAFAVALLDENGKVLDLEDKPQKPKSNLAIYATYFFRKETCSMFAQYLNEGNNPDLIGAFPQWLYKRRDVYAYKMNGECYDIGTIEMYNKMNGVSV
ncbi:MAG: nucleotidyltransferase family protein [Clostridiales bacterium]|jgi:glucose-1-phosphate thymidylyltransferase|nr:nucleotidyltransferase family protein [Clostridiales bacterium]